MVKGNCPILKSLFFYSHQIVKLNEYQPLDNHKYKNPEQKNELSNKLSSSLSILCLISLTAYPATQSFSSWIMTTSSLFPYSRALFSQQDARRNGHDLDEPCDTFHEQQHSQ